MILAKRRLRLFPPFISGAMAVPPSETLCTGIQLSSTVKEVPRFSRGDVTSDKEWRIMKVTWTSARI